MDCFNSTRYQDPPCPNDPSQREWSEGGLNLEMHPRVDRVLYPGLSSHEQYDLAKRQMNGFTGMVSVDVGTLERTKAPTENLRIFSSEPRASVA